MFSRREFLYLGALGAAAAVRGAALMTGKQRVDCALKGQDVDRTPFSFWHHFGLEKLPAERHAQATLDFHHRFHTDLVKVMSDYPFPKPAGEWYELKVLNDPFPEQLRALELISEGLIMLAFDCSEHLSQLQLLAERYADRKPDLADLCLIRMSELFPRHSIITVDREDFRVYRRNKRETIPLICPPEN